MSWLIFNVLSGVFIFLVALFLKLHLFKTREGELTKVHDEWAFNLKRASYPTWEFLLVFIVCCIPVVNWIVFACQLIYILSCIGDREYIFSIINLNGIHDDEISLNNFKEQWALSHKFQYKLYKFIKRIFTSSIV